MQQLPWPCCPLMSNKVVFGKQLYWAFLLWCLALGIVMLPLASHVQHPLLPRNTVVQN